MIETIEVEKVTRAQAERWKPRYERPKEIVFANKKEAQAYKEQEEQRWYEGYNGMDGWYYKYLSQYYLKDGFGNMIPPAWRDGDDFIVSKSLAEAREMRDDTFTLKRREYGFSSYGLSFQAIETALRHPGSNSRLTSYNENAIVVLMEEKIEAMSNYVFRDSETAYQKIYGLNSVLWKPKMHYTKNDMTLSVDFGDGIVSKIVGVQTTKGPKAAKNMEGTRILFAGIDEFFLHPFAKKVRESADGSRKIGLVNEGRIFLGGSAGDATEEGASAARDLWENHETYGLKIMFLPGTLCIEKAEELDDRGRKTGKLLSFMVNGYSLQDEALEWIKKTRTRLNQLADKGPLRQFTKAYPIHVDEIFETLGDDTWDQSDKERFEKQRKAIFVGTNKFEPSVLDERQDGTINIRKVTESPIMILETPRHDDDCILGIDPTPITGRDKSEDLSKFAVVVKSRTRQKYLAYYIERTKDIARIEYIVYKLWKAFSGKKRTVEIERNRGDALIVQAAHKGHTEMFSYEPMEWRPTNTKSFEIGYAKHVHNADTIASFLMQFARMHDPQRGIYGIENVWDLTMLNQIESFNVGNKDLADAMQACEILDWDLRLKEEKMKASLTAGDRVKKMPYVTIVNGKRVIRYADSNEGIREYEKRSVIDDIKKSAE